MLLRLKAMVGVYCCQAGSNSTDLLLENWVEKARVCCVVDDGDSNWPNFVKNMKEYHPSGKAFLADGPENSHFDFVYLRSHSIRKVENREN